MKGAMMQDTPLSAYPDEPIYNMKAVTQRTGIPAATLRAWERRYHALAPRRSGGNYRLYSERDIALLRWLQAQLDAGLSISRAVALLERLRERELSGETVESPGEYGARLVLEGEPQAKTVAAWERLNAELHDALLAMDEQHAGLVLAEAFALYTTEDICARLIVPCLVRIGDDWFDQHATVVQEHFATSYLMARLMALFNAQPPGHGPLILVGCAPGERHELGALMLALMLRRAGYNVRYLGADVPLDDLVKSVEELHPRVVALSAVLTQTATRLEELSDMLAQAKLRVQLVFGGRAFVLDEALRSRVGSDSIGIGTSLAEGVSLIGRLLASEIVATAGV
jgi:methanogenic corrinoid protein MtbC1